MSTLILDKVKIFPNSTYTVPAVIYRSDTAVKRPLVIFLHGMGEAGTTGTALYNQGLPLVLKNGFNPPFPIIMVAPQRSSYSPDPAWLPCIIQDMIDRFDIDTDKIYITGLSAGGWGTYGSQLNITEAFANLIAAILPLSGATQDINKTNFNWFFTSKTPTWAIVGGNDISYKEQNQYMVDQINLRVPGLAKIDIRPGIAHGGWTEIYNGTWKDTNNKTIWDWLSDKTNATAPVNMPPLSNAGPDQTVANTSTTLFGSASDGDGIVVGVVWTQISGSPATIGASTSYSTPIAGLQNGIYTFRFTATDDKGATSFDDVVLTVTIPPKPIIQLQDDKTWKYI